ncbi:hypothetical protein FB45DRAFT_910006 [Roridomyces roridus]|uniref:DUF6533 domain-containing protein n=1 Tax=Roridomyces roridus TaxID=1738132 RepID=A0AAD7BZA4_9AGAR|nr:hypothetical protein FB45DRAFT_910006 [Roridomyces roridus]
MASLVDSFQEFFTLRMISAVSLSLALYDHGITFDEEVATIWGNENTRWHSRVVFIVNRYVTLGVLSYVAYLFSGSATTLSNSVCEQFFWVYGITCVFFGATSHFVMVVRIHRLWDGRNAITRNLTTTFVVFIIATIVLGVFVVKELNPEFNGLLHTCVLPTKPSIFVGLLGVTCSMDFVLLLFIVFNAMDRPRLMHVPIVSELQKDGVAIFFISFAIRLSNLIITIFVDAPQAFMATTTAWALYTILNGRLQMRLEGLSLRRSVPRQSAAIMLSDINKV